MALGVALVVAVLVIGQVVQKSFASGNSLGYNVIIGAQRWPVGFVAQYRLLPESAHREYPLGVLPGVSARNERSDHRDGKFAGDVGLAIPVCLGDVVGENGQYRVVGTTPEMFSQMLQSTFSAGENFKQQDFRSAVIGADVAKHLNLKVGDSFQPQHGVGGEKHIAFKIVGVLDRTSTPIDRVLSSTWKASS